MVHKYAPIQQAIAKVLRDTKISNATLNDDIWNWVADALDYMRTSYQYFLQHKEIDVANFGCLLPRCVDLVVAVSYNGSKLRYGRSLVAKNIPKKYFTVWEFEGLTIEAGEIFSEAVKSATKANVYDATYYNNLYYDINGNSLDTNLNKGKIEVWYLGALLDKDGYPQVPDNANIKEAIVEYVKYKLQATNEMPGNPDNTWMRFELFAGRGMNDCTYPTPEMRQSVIDGARSLMDEEEVDYL